MLNFIDLGHLGENVPLIYYLELRDTEDYSNKYGQYIWTVAQLREFVLTLTSYPIARPTPTALQLHWLHCCGPNIPGTLQPNGLCSGRSPCLERSSPQICMTDSFKASLKFLFLSVALPRPCYLKL